MPSAPVATPLRGALWPGRETSRGHAFPLSPLVVWKNAGNRLIFLWLFAYKAT